MTQPASKKLAFLIGCGLASATVAVHAQEPIKIKDLLANPSAYHRQAIVIHGKVETPNEMRGVDSWGQQLCGQQFTLDDETGQLPVRSVVVCQKGDEREWWVRHGEVVTIEATMEAAPNNLKTVTGRGLGASALVTRVHRDDLGGTRVSIDPIR